MIACLAFFFFYFDVSQYAASFAHRDPEPSQRRLSWSSGHHHRRISRHRPTDRFGLRFQGCQGSVHPNIQFCFFRFLGLLLTPSTTTTVVVTAKSVTETPNLPGTIFSVAKEIEELGGDALVFFFPPETPSCVVPCCWLASFAWVAHPLWCSKSRRHRSDGCESDATLQTHRLPRQQRWRSLVRFFFFFEMTVGADQSVHTKRWKKMVDTPMKRYDLINEVIKLQPLSRHSSDRRMDRSMREERLLRARRCYHTCWTKDSDTSSTCLLQYTSPCSTVRQLLETTALIVITMNNNHLYCSGRIAYCLSKFGMTLIAHGLGAEVCFCRKWQSTYCELFNDNMVIFAKGERNWCRLQCLVARFLFFETSSLKTGP